MSRRDFKCLICRNDIALAGGLVLVALAGFAIAGAILAEKQPVPTWVEYWRGLPFWFKCLIGGALGLAFSLGAGRLTIPALRDRLERELTPYHEEMEGRRIPPGVTGYIERFGFTLFAMAYPASSLTAMVGWLALKMASNWNKDLLTRAREDDLHGRLAARFEKLVWNRHAFLGLLMGFISMLFAWIGGIGARLIMGLDPNP